MLRFNPLDGSWKSFVKFESDKAEYQLRIAETTWFGRSIRIVSYDADKKAHDFERKFNRNSVINYLNRHCSSSESPIRRGWFGGWLGGDSDKVIQQRYAAVVGRLLEEKGAEDKKKLHLREIPPPTRKPPQCPQ